ncbi:7-deoxyloganetin glucosyltransferase-like [Cornus florida]|uniref:7-deoxyloganetin glucosyltransferase-like n=1 Tax=Cornus florida TaxID=4283 RepID=UPI00289730A2|nr:7-deoxyloganetin glucosyltransferase-like [Cornus florida]
MSSVHTLERPHAVCVPCPAQGHITPMLKLAKLLHLKGFHITFVNTEFNHRRLLKSRGPDSLNGLSSFRFETIPDGLPPSDADVTQDTPSLCASVDKNCLVPFRDLLSKLSNISSSNVPPVTCIVADSVMIFTLAAAAELGIPGVLLWTASACSFMCYVQYSNLIEKGITPLRGVSLETVIDWIPGMEGIRLKDMPSFIRSTDPDEFMVKFAIDATDRSQKASAIIFNTFEDLEHDVVEALSSMFPPIYTIGPLHLLLKQIGDSSLKFIESNLWKEDTQCLEWLDSKEPNSVVYVNFGSITVMTPNQLVEFAWGLANSNQTFLWVIRPDLVAGDSAILPPEFLSETRDRGLLASWCPQEQVLGHRSIGGFLTHNGWNSTLESISFGVPMLCWPFFADQQTNCWFCCSKWGIGMEIDSDVKRDEVEFLVKELMFGDKGKEMKVKAMEWKKLADKASTSSVGSSYMNLEEMINQVLLSKILN